MARARPSEADRMRRHNEEFRYALAHGVTLVEARRRLAQLSMFELERRVHPPLKPGCAALCGTQAPVHASEQTEERPHFWWMDR